MYSEKHRATGSMGVSSLFFSCTVRRLVLKGRRWSQSGLNRNGDFRILGSTSQRNIVFKLLVGRGGQMIQLPTLLPITREITNMARSSRIPSNPWCIVLPAWPLASCGRFIGVRRTIFDPRLGTGDDNSCFGLPQRKLTTFHQTLEGTKYKYSLDGARIDLKYERVWSPFTAFAVGMVLSWVGFAGSSQSKSESGCFCFLLKIEHLLVLQHMFNTQHC